MKQLLIAATLVTQLGCLGAVMPKPLAAPHAFGPGKRAALVMVNAHPKITIWASSLYVNSNGTLLDAEPVFAGAVQALREELGASRQFTLVPEETVLGSPAYAAAAGRSPDYGPITFLTPPGYKYLTEEAEYPKLARAIPADVAFAVGMYFSFTDSGRALVRVQVGGFDGAGNPAWRMASIGEASSDRSVFEATVPERAQLYRDATRDAVRRILAMMDEQLGQPG